LLGPAKLSVPCSVLRIARDPPCLTSEKYSVLRTQYGTKQEIPFWGYSLSFTVTNTNQLVILVYWPRAVYNCTLD
jgi:hypothetical protein